MSLSVFPLSARPCVPVEDETATYALHRVFCVGRNYAAHAIEMGSSVDPEVPFYFTKSLFSCINSGSTVDYPPGTSNYHHEVELVAAIGVPLFQADQQTAEKAIFGYACGLDMTRRDLQEMAKHKSLPWDLSKDFENSCVLGNFRRSEAFSPRDQGIRLSVNGVLRQQASISELVRSIPALLEHLSRYYHLVPGDILMTGTPAGVGPVLPGDQIRGEIDGLPPVLLTLSS